MTDKLQPRITIWGNLIALALLFGGLFALQQMVRSEKEQAAQTTQTQQPAAPEKTAEETLAETPPQETSTATPEAEVLQETTTAEVTPQSEPPSSEAPSEEAAAPTEFAQAPSPDTTEAAPLNTQEATPPTVQETPAPVVAEQKAPKRIHLDVSILDNETTRAEYRQKNLELNQRIKKIAISTKEAGEQFYIPFDDTTNDTAIIALSPE